ncbi:Nitroreductase [Pseudarcicella hirudinis]|uniref:Nitroreductase n=1 Tax=Pseudarcicella hirudinis TaxID=1079859 RepID=A0A1I5MQ69_9BACT|nr:nitroreductase family protein [Pseudarcicella hirudinis]SFP11774.1 Nitroreductase [Pseudarcicella hirudinis]
MMELLTIKEANSVELNEQIRKRWSPRAFSPASILPEDLHTIFEAASWAPSAMNEQPWEYIYALKENEEGFGKLLSCLVPANAVWAKHAAALVLTIAKHTYAHNGKENPTAFHDLGMANQNLLIQAISMDIYGHPMGGFDKKKAVELFELKDSESPVCVIALGYLGDPDQLDEGLKTREFSPRKRKELHEFVKQA